MCCLLVRGVHRQKAELVGLPGKQQNAYYAVCFHRANGGRVIHKTKDGGFVRLHSLLGLQARKHLLDLPHQSHPGVQIFFMCKFDFHNLMPH